MGLGWEKYTKELLNFDENHFTSNSIIMALKSERDVSLGREKLYRDQIVTTADLQDFKEDLLQRLSKIIADNYNSGAKKWVKSYEVRELLGISPGTLQNLRVNGTLPFTKVGGIIFYEMKDIQKMINKNKVSFPTRFQG